MLTGCAKGEPLTDYIDNDLAIMIDDGTSQYGIRYTVYDESQHKQMTYTTNDEQIKQELMAVLKAAKLDVSKGDSNEVNDKNEADAEKLEYLTMCGTLVDSNGGMYNSVITISDRYFYDGSEFYDISNATKLRACIDKIIDKGIMTPYSMDIDEELSPFTGYWLGDDMEISIYQGGNGLYYLNIMPEESSSYPDAKITICSLDYEGGKCTFKGLDEMARDYSVQIDYQGDRIILDGMVLHKAMME